MSDRTYEIKVRGFSLTPRMKDMGITGMYQADAFIWMATFEKYENLQWEIPMPIAAWLLGKEFAMDSVIERVARAIAYAQIENPNDTCELARAAIVAMREPSAKMIRAGHAEVRRYDPDSGSAYQAADNTFSAMIDAALSEGGE